MDTTKDTTRAPLGLRLCQIAVPALAIPSAIGVAKFFSVADGKAGQWTAQGVIAAAGFELMNVGLSILDIRHPSLHETVQRVRFWSVATAIALNVIAHYAEKVPALDRLDGVGAILALVASVPLALLYVALAGLLHGISEGDHAERDLLAALRAELAQAREALAAKVAELATAAARLASFEVEAREALAQAREQHAAELARVEAQAREGQQGLATELAQAREEVARLAAQAREGQAAERERARLTREAESLRAEVGRLRDRSREALMREAQALAAAHGWGASEVGKALGWPESTVRGWIGQAALPTAAAAD